MILIHGGRFAKPRGAFLDEKQPGISVSSADFGDAERILKEVFVPQFFARFCRFDGVSCIFSVSSQYPLMICTQLAYDFPIFLVNIRNFKTARKKEKKKARKKSKNKNVY